MSVAWFRWSTVKSPKWVSFTELQSKRLETAKEEGKDNLKQGKWTIDISNMTAINSGSTSEVRVRRISGKKLRRARSLSPPKLKRLKQQVATLQIPVSIQAVIFASNLLTTESVDVLSDLLKNTPSIARMSLNSAADKMVGNVRNFLKSMGRVQKGDGFDIVFPKKYKIIPSIKYPLHPNFSLSGTEIKSLMDKTIITTLSTDTQPTILPFGHDLTDDEQVDSQLLMVSGPVYVTYDSCYNLQAKGSTIHCCSIPGINFSYSTADMSAFTEPKNSTSRKRVLKIQEVKSRMSQIWYHTLAVMSKAKIQYPVLCAIGCGEFKGKFKAVPQLWAETLAEVLSKTDFEFDVVIVSLPTFGDDNYSEFETVFATEKNLKTPVLLVENYGMLTIADRLSSQGHSSGILNPSDVEAVRKGHIGMFWDGGHIALEEIIALQTTLLLHHRSLNVSLWERDPIKIDDNHS